MPNREENLQKIREMRLDEQSKQVAAGGKFQADLEVDFTSANGSTYKGVVTVKRPTVGETIRMGVLKAQLLKREMGEDLVPLELLNPEISYFAMVVGTLQVVVVKAPEWFLNPEAVVDFDLLIHIYSRYEGWLDSFRKPSDPQPQGNSETSE
jgi:hypothetical protein